MRHIVVKGKQLEGPFSSDIPWLLGLGFGVGLGLGFFSSPIGEQK